MAPLLVLSLALLVSRAASQDAPLGPNYAHAREIRGLLHWERFPLLVFFAPGRLLSRERKDLVLAGFDEWVHATHGVVSYKLVTTEAQADLVVTFASHVIMPGLAQTGGQTTLTCTGAVLKKAAMQLVEKDDDPAGFQAISAHEFGHALGIDGHSDDSADMMYSVMIFTLFTVRNEEIILPTPPRTVTQRDVNTLRSAYPSTIFSPGKR